MLKISKYVLLFSAAVLLLGTGGYFAWQYFRSSAAVEPPQTAEVHRGHFVHEILERGSVDSASNVSIRSQVESAGGLTIISVVPEGTIVKKGDLLVELDSSALRENVMKQSVAVLSSQSKLAQSQAALKSAELTLMEYTDGTYIQERKTIENEIFAAEEEVRTQEDNLSYYKRLLERGYVTESKVDADLIVLAKAVNAKEIAELKLRVLNEYTKAKNVNEYEAKIASCKATVESDSQSLKLDQERLAHLERQLELCRITAPQDGQVVYYMPRWGGDDDMIKEGKKVFERQVLLQLPDPRQMQVKGLVNEATIRLVKTGQKAAIRLEAFPNQVFEGVVKDVNDYPEPNNWMGGAMSKEYMTTITMLHPPEGIKSGLTAEARIMVNEISRALMLPSQAVFEHGGKTYALTFRDDKWDKVEVKTGTSNGNEVVIREGLKEGDQVVLGAWGHRDKVELPKVAGGKKRSGSGKPGEKPEPPSADRPPSPPPSSPPPPPPRPRGPRG